MAPKADTQISVRPAEPSDAPRWIALRTALWPTSDPNEHAAEAAAFFAGTLGEPEAVLLAVGPDDAIVGFAEVSRRPYADGCPTSPVGYLEGWYVEPKVRHQGVGRALLEAVEQWARRLGCRELGSDTELENEGSAAAHRALGFEEVAVLRCFRKALD